MARVEYDTQTVFGSTLADAVNDLTNALNKIDRVYAAMDLATNAGTDTTTLVNGSFGARTGEGGDLWTAVGSLRGVLAGASGLETFRAQLDQGG